MIVVIPCFNEAERLDKQAVQRLAEDPPTRILFVDDGSTDRTLELLTSLKNRFGESKVMIHRQPTNRGKGEAVRVGMRRALLGGAEITGYLDADFATPPEEMLRLRDTIESRRADVVLGSRVALLGREVQRRISRHLLGRVYATTASIVLNLRVYDTQCGAKLFRRSPALEHAVSVPFRSRWSFDVEMLGRLMAGGPGVVGTQPDQIIEVPLNTWREKRGSKLSRGAAVKAGLDLFSLAAEVGRRGSAGFYPG